MRILILGLNYYSNGIVSFAITHFFLQFNKSSQWEIDQQIFIRKPEISGIVLIQGITSEKIHAWLYFHTVEITAKNPKEIQQV